MTLNTLIQATEDTEIMPVTHIFPALLMDEIAIDRSRWFFSVNSVLSVAN